MTLMQVLALAGDVNNGSSRLTSLYIKLLQAHATAQRHVVAVLDDNQKLFGRTMCGVPVVGAAD
jgi:FlaA1/EpsC-like NDP-sugar epimerase